jgi:hypothetical protein
LAGKDIIIPLGERSIANYISAISEMYRTQKSLGTNPYEPIRGSGLKAMVGVSRRRERKRKLDLNEDRLAGTSIDNYDDGQKKRLSDYFLKKGTYNHMRNRVDFLVGHAMLLRGDNRRAMQFSELFHETLKDEGKYCALFKKWTVWLKITRLAAS